MKELKYFALLFFCISSCKKSEESTKPLARVKYEVALDFINEYNKEFPHSGTLEWVNGNKLVSQNLKDGFKRVLDSARVADPEFGLDFDPILNIQDSFQEDFEIKKIDSTEGYVTVCGKVTKDFEIVLRVVEIKGNSFVDGSGIVNINESKVAKH